MSVRTATAAALLTGAAWLALGTAAPAFALCDAYSGGCPSTAPTQGPGGGSIGGDDDSPATGDQGPTTGSTSGPGGAGDAGTDTGAGAGDAGDNQAPGSGRTTGNPSTLPFTGGELVLMSAVGLGVLAGGTALVVAGRRKARTTA